MNSIIKIAFLLIFAPLASFSQTDTQEFEGTIKYNHLVISKDKNYNINVDYQAIGKHSEYYYKEGNYKFVNHDAYFKADLFRSKYLRNFLVLSHSDTVLSVDSRIADLEVIEFEVKEGVDTILNYPCHVISLKLKPINQDSPISYRRYYFSEKVPINPAFFKHCKGNAYELIYSTSKSLPLKIEFEWPDRTVIWEAYEVVEEKISNDVFRIEPNWIINKVN
jgi:hypothetical protein